MVKFADLNFTIKKKQAHVSYTNVDTEQVEDVIIDGVSPIILKHLRLLSRGNTIASPSLQMAIVDSSNIDSEYSQTMIVKGSQVSSNIATILKAKGQKLPQVDIANIVIKSLNSEPVKEPKAEKLIIHNKALIAAVTQELTKSKENKPQKSTLASNIQKLKDLKNK